MKEPTFTKIHSRDFDHHNPAAEWIDITTLGSDYEEQMDARRFGQYRHRPAFSNLPWRDGRRPIDK